MRAFLIALILLTAPYGAWGQWSGNPDPPARFVHKYKGGKLVVSRVHPDEVWPLCHWLFSQHHKDDWLAAMNPSDDLYGCAVPFVSPSGLKFSRCHIVVARGDEETYIHELAHCNGWSASHPAD